MVELTCKNHTGAKYLTKNPYQRGLHFIEADPSLGYGTECKCPFSDLVVVKHEVWHSEDKTFRMEPMKKPVPVKEYKFIDYNNPKATVRKATNISLEEAMAQLKEKSN